MHVDRVELEHWKWPQWDWLSALPQLKHHSKWQALTVHLTMLQPVSSCEGWKHPGQSFNSRSFCLCLCATKSSHSWFPSEGQRQPHLAQWGRLHSAQRAAWGFCARARQPLTQLSLVHRKPSKPSRSKFWKNSCFSIAIQSSSWVHPAILSMGASFFSQKGQQALYSGKRPFEMHLRHTAAAQHCNRTITLTLDASVAVPTVSEHREHASRGGLS